MQPDNFISWPPRLRTARVLAIDLETTGLDPHISHIRLIQLTAEGMPVLVIDAPAFLSDPEGVNLLRSLLANSAVKRG